MKISKLVLFSFLILSNSINAQILEKTFYISIGTTYSNMIGTDIDKTSFLNGFPSDIYTNGSSGDRFKYGLKFGLGFQKLLIHGLYYQIEVNYERKGCKIKLDEFDGSLTVSTSGFSNISLDYLTFPFMTKFYFDKDCRFFANGGFTLGYLLGANEKGDDLIVDGKKYNFSNDKTSRYSFYEFGYRFGIGTTLKLFNQVFDTGLMGSWSINDIESMRMIPGTKGYFHNQSFQLYLVYQLNK